MKQVLELEQQAAGMEGRHVQSGLTGLRAGLAAVLLGVLCACAQAADQAAQRAGEQKLRVGPVYTSADGKKAPEFPRLEVAIALSEARAMPAKADLTLVEDGVDGNHAVEVVPFESTGYGVGEAVAIDVSGSMAGRPLQILRGSLYKFVSDARAQDAVGVLTIADDAVWDVPFGSEKNMLRSRLQELRSRGTMTRLYDGLLTALGRFGADLPARRELTLISDGHDEGSRAHVDDVVRMARNRGIAINTIGLTRSSLRYLNVLQTLAADTGGSYRQVHSDEELQGLIENAMGTIKATPVATFEARQITGDGKQHRLGVRWQGTPALLGEMMFHAPEVNRFPAWGWFKRLPVWEYTVLGLVAAGLGLLVLTLALRRDKRRVKATPYAIPAAPASGTELLRNAGAVPTGLVAGMRAPVNRSVPVAPAPPAPVALKETGRSPARTQLAGIFQSAGPTVARLEVLTGRLAGQMVEVPRREFWVGAAPGNDLTLTDDATASSRHAYLLFEEPILLLVDNRSTNGTRINGQILRDGRQPLRDGDQIQIGQTLLRVRTATV